MNKELMEDKMAVKDIFAEGGRLPDPVSSNNETQVKEPTLDELLSELDRQDLTEAKRTMLKLKVTEMNTRIAESNARIRELENGKPGVAAAANKTQEDPATKNQKDISANALLLMERGVSPDVVARYILSASTTQPNTALPGGGGGGFDMAGFASLVNTIKDLVKPSGDGGDPEMKLMVKTLAASVEALMKKDQDSKDALLKDLMLEVKNIKAGSGQVNSTTPLPKALIFEHNPATGKFEKTELAPGDTYILPTSPTPTGKTIDEIREENRHKEAEEKLKADIAGKQQSNKVLGDVAASIVEVGSTLVGSVLDKTGSPVAKPRNSGQANEITYKKCENPQCGFDIPIPPGAWRITCPNCKNQDGSPTVYTDWSKAPPGVQRPGVAPAVVGPSVNPGSSQTENPAAPSPGPANTVVSSGTPA
jgi:hypothetical protein